MRRTVTEEELPGGNPLRCPDCRVISFKIGANERDLVCAQCGLVIARMLPELRGEFEWNFVRERNRWEIGRHLHGWVPLLTCREDGEDASWESLEEMALMLNGPNWDPASAEGSGSD